MRSYGFGRFRLDAIGHLLYRDDQRIQLTPKAIDVLLTLIESGGAPVTREDLLHRVWSGSVVEEGTLSTHISLLRKTLGREYIETIPKRGYRFTGDVQTSPAKRERSLLVVLPFENLSGTKKSDAFSDGLTEEMISQLGRTSPDRLGVIARTSSMTYKSTPKTIEQIGRELGVSHVLEGSVRRAGNRVRITAQLIQVSDQTHLWADNYESAVEDILALQSSVARQVAKQIHIRLLPSEPVRRVIPDAYQAYLQGRYLWNRRTEKDLREALRCFQTAIDKDPDYPQPYAGIADVNLSLMDMGFMRTADGTQEARTFAAKGLALDDTVSDAHVSLGHAAFHEFDWSVAAAEFARAIELNPNSATARFYYSNYLASMMRFDEALQEAEEARRLDPVPPAMRLNLASILWLARRYDEVVAHCRDLLKAHPDHARAHEDLGRAYEQMGRFEEAIRSLRKSISSAGVSHTGLSSLAHAYAVAGKRDEANRILQELQTVAKTRYVSAWDVALIHVGLGQLDEAFARLAEACDERSPALPFIKSNPRLDPLRDDRRFRDLLKRVALA